MRDSASITEETLGYVNDRMLAVHEAIDAEAYDAAAGYAYDVASLLKALNARLVKERVATALSNSQPSEGAS